MKCIDCHDCWEIEDIDGKITGFICWADGFGTRDIEDVESCPDWCRRSE